MNPFRAAWNGTVSWWLIRSLMPGQRFTWRLCYRAYREDLGHKLPFPEEVKGGNDQ